MVIVQIITTLAYGGAEKICIDLSNGLIQNEKVQKVFLISLFDLGAGFREATVIHPDVTLITLSKKPGLDLRIMNRLNNVLINIKPDIIHTHLTALFYTVKYILINKSKTKIFHTIHNIPKNDVHWLALKVYKFLFRRQYAIPIAISPEIKKMIEEYFNISNVSLINNFALKPQITEAYDLVKKEIQEIKKNENTLIFLNVARISPQKNQLILLDIFKILKNENIILIMIGSTDKAFKDYEEMLIRKVKESSNAFYLGNKSNVGDYMSMSDAYILSSLYEGLPISLLEAISLGLIPIVPAVGGIASVMKNSEMGYLAKSSTIEDILSSIYDFLHLNSTDKLQMAKNCQNVFSEKYSLKSGVTQHINLYNSYG